MALKISNLLKWKRPLELKDAEGNQLKDENGKDIVVYMRIIGDHDLNETYRLARVRSSKLRRKLRDPESLEWAETVEPVREASAEECTELIKTARTSNLHAEALSAVPRPDEVTIKEIAQDPDAPTLEEQEKLDEANEKQDKEYQEAVAEYEKTRVTVLENQLKELSLEELRKIAEEEISNVLALSAFLTEMQDQKVFRATFEDKECKIRAFESIEDYRETDAIIKEQLVEAYAKLEQNPEDLKN